MSNLPISSSSNRALASQLVKDCSDCFREVRDPRGGVKVGQLTPKLMGEVEGLLGRIRQIDQKTDTHLSNWKLALDAVKSAWIEKLRDDELRQECQRCFSSREVNVEEVSAVKIAEVRNLLGRIEQTKNAANREPSLLEWQQALQRISTAWDKVHLIKSPPVLSSSTALTSAVKGAQIPSAQLATLSSVSSKIPASLSDAISSSTTDLVTSSRRAAASSSTSAATINLQPTLVQGLSPAPVSSSGTKSAFFIACENRYNALVVLPIGRLIDIAAVQAFLEELQLEIEHADPSPQRKADLEAWKRPLQYILHNQDRFVKEAAKIEFARLCKQFKNPFESALPPVGIPNKGNTCFAASWIQLVAMNTLFSGAYKTLLPVGHYANAVLHDYHQAQKAKRLVQSIDKMRAAFGGAKDTQQHDAVELSKKIHSHMKLIPEDGQVLIEEEKVVFGMFMEQFVQGNMRPYTDQKNSRVAQPILSLKMDLHKPKTSLDELVKYNLDQLYFVELPNVLVFDIGRLEGLPLKNQQIDCPLFYQIPKERKKHRNSPDALYTLQGFLSHSLGSTAGGHYTAYHQHDGQFYKADDGVISLISIEQFLAAAKTAYMPLYAKLIPR